MKLLKNIVSAFIILFFISNIALAATTGKGLQGSHGKSGGLNATQSYPTQVWIDNECNADIFLFASTPDSSFTDWVYSGELYLVHGYAYYPSVHIELRLTPYAAPFYVNNVPNGVTLTVTDYALPQDAKNGKHQFHVTVS